MGERSVTTVTKECPFCHTARSLTVTVRQLEAWQKDTKIQDAFPELTASEREFLMTGICDPCWDSMG